MDIYSDTYYIQRVLRGDIDCFASIVDRYSSRIFTLIYRIVGNREDAEELAQDTFMTAFSKLDKFEGKSSFSTWLYRIAYNLAISATRKPRLQTLSINESVVTAEDLDVAEVEIDESREMIELLEVALRRLSADETAMITLFYHDNKSLDEIAHIMNISLSNAKVKLYRCRQHLMSIISELQRANNG